MYHVLLILLHRPFVADGHLYHNARSVSVNSLLICITAATNIINLLKAYHRAFSIQRAPYLISYATYVSATIHVRLAAQRGQNSDAHRMLATCLAVFGANQTTNWAAKRANMIVEGLMKKLNVKVSSLQSDLEDEEPSGNQNHYGHRSMPDISDNAYLAEANLGFSPSFDIDAVIQSFAPSAAPRREFNDNVDNGVQTDGVAGNRNAVVRRAGGEISQLQNDLQTSEQVHPSQAMPHDDAWVYQWQFTPQLPDDVLFGFDGSATDGFCFQHDLDM